MAIEYFLLDYRICFSVAYVVYENSTDLVCWKPGFGGKVFF